MSRRIPGYFYDIDDKDPFLNEPGVNLDPAIYQNLAVFR
jgi:hypothetical protein